LVIVPSISDTTTLSVCSHMKMRAAQATTPDEDSEKVIVFAPGRRSRACYDIMKAMNSEQHYILTNCSDVSLSVFAYCTFGLPAGGGDNPLGGTSGKDVGGVRSDGVRVLSGVVGT
jgi:hypothetical protein